jgi:hypothetical protein
MPARRRARRPAGSFEAITPKSLELFYCGSIVQIGPSAGPGHTLKKTRPTNATLWWLCVMLSDMLLFRFNCSTLGRGCAGHASIIQTERIGQMFRTES